MNRCDRIQFRDAEDSRIVQTERRYVLHIFIVGFIDFDFAWGTLERLGIVRLKQDRLGMNGSASVVVYSEYLRAPTLAAVIKGIDTARLATSLNRERKTAMEIEHVLQ